MGAVPTALLVGLAAPADLAACWVERFADGLREECDVVGAGVVGGDVVRSDVLVLAVTALGDLEGRRRSRGPARSQATWWRSPGGWAGRRPGLRR